MLGFYFAQRFYVCTAAIDMRKGIDGLCGAVRHVMEDDPLTGYVFILFNKPQDKIKLFVWDKNGFVLYQKRLERGRFEELISSSDLKMKTTYDHLLMRIS